MSGCILRSTVPLGFPGSHAFLYTGPSVAEGKGPRPSERLATEIGPLAFQREEAAYARRLGPTAGSAAGFRGPCGL